MMHKFEIRQAYGAFVAEDQFGNTVWAQSEDELLRLFGGAS